MATLLFHWVTLLLSSCSYIDQGHNPELFTRHQLEQTLEDHEAVQRKVQAYKVYTVSYGALASPASV